MSAAETLYRDNGGQRVADNPADPYMTMLGYFNSLRELGGTRRLIEDELTSRLHQYGKRKRLGEVESPFSDRPDLSEALELTSRYSTSKVSEAKDALNRPFREPGSVDIALATNMISVGLDIPRLGLMAVFAQPKMTSEYIQATSRVGRSTRGPGLVLTLYNWARPRDLSHYETFEHYHADLYRQVEALSVTPFAPALSIAALSAVLVALARQGTDQPTWNPNAGAQLVDLEGLQQEITAILNSIVARAEEKVTGSLDVADLVRQMLQERVDRWGCRAEASGRQPRL